MQAAAYGLLRKQDRRCAGIDVIIQNQLNIYIP